jgi:aminoglycoside phosphotransferase (APT) family kinase protein
MGKAMVQADLYAELQMLCRRSFPERLEQRISQVRTAGEGRHPMVSFSLAWREGHRPRVERLLLRRYADDWTWWSVADVQKAARAWEVGGWLYGQGLPLPALYASGTADQAPYLLMARAGGRSYEIERPADREAYVEAIAAFLARLHRLTPPDAVRRVLPEARARDEIARLWSLASAWGDEGLAEVLAGLASKEIAPGTVTGGEAIAEEAATGELVAGEALAGGGQAAGEEIAGTEMEAFPPCVLHGDLQVGRVRADARGLTAVLDWENAALGDPRWDLARVANELYEHEAHDLAEQLYRRYEEQSGLPLRGMGFWEALSAAQQWTLLAWLKENGSTVNDGTLDAARGSTWRAWTRIRYERGDAN